MYRDNIKQTHRNWPEWDQISHFDPKGQNHGNYETTAKIMCIDVYFVTVMNLVTYLKYIVYFIIVLKYRHKQFSVQYKRDEYKTHYKIESNFRQNLGNCSKEHMCCHDNQPICYFLMD